MKNFKELREAKVVEESVDLEERQVPQFVVKYAKSKRGPIYQTKFQTEKEAEKFLAQKKKEGMNGIISKGGKPVSMQKMADLQKESVELSEAPDLEKMSNELLKHKSKGVNYEKAAAYVRTMFMNSSLSVQDKAMKGLLTLLKNMDLKDRTTITKILKDNGFKVKGGQLMRESLDESGMTSAQKKKFDTLYKKMDGGKEHKAIRQKILNPVKADDAFHALVKKMAMESVELDESVDCLEEAMLNEFSDAQLNQLKKAYSDLEKINVTSPTYKKLKKMLADMDVKPLEKVARKKIKFVSQIAARELLAKGGPKLKAGEYMEF